jgi:hypothetical protein
MGHEQQKWTKDIASRLFDHQLYHTGTYDSLNSTLNKSYTIQSIAIIMRLLLAVIVCLCVLRLPVPVVGQLNLDFGDGGDLSDLLAGLNNQNKDGTCPSACAHQSHLMAAPKRRIRPYSNGCSVPSSMRSSIGDYSHFTSCCDLHDT